MIAIWHQLGTNSMCTQNVKSSDIFEERRPADILLLVTDEVLYHTNRLSNISFQNILINLSNNLFKNFLICNEANFLNEPKCGFVSPEHDQRRIFTFRLEKNIALNNVKNILDKINIYYAIKPQFDLFSLVLISNSKVIKMFEFIFKFSNYLVFYMDVNSSFNFFYTNHEGDTKQDNLNVCIAFNFN